jgi:hypothetical protein
MITTQNHNNMQELEDEIWKKYSDVYEVSNYGRVRSVDRIVKKKDGRLYELKGKVLTQMDSGVGYRQVSLGREQKAAKVHRLVGLLFIPNPELKKTINHKDGIKTNNHYKNLEWATYAENNKHAIDTGLNKRRRV